MDMTAERRQELAVELENTEARAASIREAALAPFKDELAGLDAHAEEIADQLGGLSLAQCETCGKFLFPGDQGHHYAEGEVYTCEEHSPTWADIKHDVENDPEAYEDAEHLEGVRAQVAAAVAEGRLDQKVVWTL